MPVPAARDDFLWFTAAPDWIASVVLMSLIFLIPFVGQMVIFGWVLEARDNLLRKENLLPSAGFSYLQRGVRPFVATVVAFAVWLLVMALFCIAFIATLVLCAAYRRHFLPP